MLSFTVFAAAFAAVIADGNQALRSSRAEGFVKALEFKHRLRVCNAYPYSAALDVFRGKGEKLTGDDPMAYKSCRDFLAPLQAGDKLEFKHRLRVCNAYPYSAALDVFRGKGEKLTGDDPMAYKSCRDFLAPLQAGDKLEFKVGDASAGTFAVSDLPNNDAVLLLVIHRHDTISTAVSFESHVFANLLNAQVAIIDTYKGAARATPRIMDAEETNKKSSRSEELRYNSVVAVNPGVYEVELMGQDGEAKSKGKLVALNRESYVVLRTGVEAQQGPSYEQELVVYPESDASTLKSGAMSSGPGALILAAVLAFFSR